MASCVFTCVSLMTNNVEHLFVCSLAVCISSLQKCQFRLCPFLTCFITEFWEFFFPDICSLSHVRFAKIFSHSVGYLFALSMVHFEAQKFFILMKTDLFFHLLPVPLVSYLGSHCLIRADEDIL